MSLTGRVGFLLIKEALMNIHVGHYSNPDQIGYESWVEPEDKSWIVFVPTDHSGPVLFSHRDPKTGAVED